MAYEQARRLAMVPETRAYTVMVPPPERKTLGLPRKAVLRWGPRGMQQLSEVRSGQFELLGYAGNSAPDHIDQFHAMPEQLKRLLKK